MFKGLSFPVIETFRNLICSSERIDSKKFLIWGKITNLLRDQGIALIIYTEHQESIHLLPSILGVPTGRH